MDVGYPGSEGDRVFASLAAFRSLAFIADASEVTPEREAVR
jgi:hypothetical protein